MAKSYCLFGGLSSVNNALTNLYTKICNLLFVLSSAEKFKQSILVLLTSRNKYVKINLQFSFKINWFLSCLDKCVKNGHKPVCYSNISGKCCFVNLY